MELDQIVEKEPGKIRRWATFLEGFEVEIEYISKETLEAINRKCTKPKWRGHQRVDELDQQAFLKEMAKHITDWRGLNSEILHRLIPIKPDASMNGQQAECTDTNKLVLLKMAYGFDDFIFRHLTELENIDNEQIEEEIKNSDALSPPD